MSTKSKPGKLLANIGSHRGRRPKAGTAEAPRGKQDKTAAEASRLRAMADRLAAMPEVDHERVAAIKQAIADGSYKVDPRGIAEKLMEFEAQQGKRR